MKSVQLGILADETRISRYMTFSIITGDDINKALKALANEINPEETVIGFGQSLIDILNINIADLRVFPAQSAPGIEIPSTPAALWCWLRGDDRGELFHRSCLIESILLPNFSLNDITDSFQFADNRDLTGYIDGTENPEATDAITAAIVQNNETGMNGSSFVAVQQWLHDFDAFNSMNTNDQDNAIGRHIIDNEEFDEAPESAHVKRAAQESFNPEAFILRRSMPWAEGMDAGLMFVAFGKSFDAYEAILNRMLGKEDGVIDALFSFTRPISSAYFWCPPVSEGKLDLSILNI
ncbi:MAG: Dyp-type peroxidase [Gammaproteobacteria bacterium]|nr:Dyp-type peroxidase [Gammaproteobacteria bacterium]MCW8910366.1 Dyp-type peroxidase [Gammaproteobacteria bacterium]MCW9004250.1 Dyp-type peroxidase [Gammaproteobacteria bacterium]MCW9055853.1 Dyp-type peroxidase [Gammaproteobacteria bacterium]